MARPIPQAVLIKISQLSSCWQRCSTAERATLQSSHRISKRHADFQIFLAQHSVDESRVKCITRARRVAATTGHSKCGRFNELAFTINDCAARAERRADKRAAITRSRFD